MMEGVLCNNNNYNTPVYYMYTIIIILCAAKLGCMYVQSLNSKDQDCIVHKISCIIIWYHMTVKLF